MDCEMRPSPCSLQQASSQSLALLQESQIDSDLRVS